MHDAAMEFIRMWAPEVHYERSPGHRGVPIIVEVGSADWNGTIRSLFPGADYMGIDVVEAPGVDVVVRSVEDYEPPLPVDGVVCCETFEHVEDWALIVDWSWRVLRDDGLMLVTCAGPGRKPHAADGSPGGPPDGEWYQNVEPLDLSQTMRHRFRHSAVVTVRDGKDVQAVAWK